MQKNIFFTAALVLGLTGCLGGGSYPAAHSAAGGADNAAMIGNVIHALGGAPAQTAVPQQTAQGGLAGILGAVGGQGNANVNVQEIAQGLLANQCSSYIAGQPMWQTARLALGNQAQYFESRICDCATRETMRTMTPDQLTQLGMSAVGGQAAMTQAAAGMLSQTAMTCMQQLVGQGLMPR